MAAVPLAFGLGQLKLPTPKEFTGKSEDFDDFSFKIKSYMSTFDARSGYLMTQSESETTSITDDMLDNFESKLATAPAVPSTTLARQLYFVLFGLVANSITTLKSVKDNNGVEAWRLLHLRYSLNKTSTDFANLTKIMNFGFREDHLKKTLSPGKT